jgi:cell division protein FtsN
LASRKKPAPKRGASRYKAPVKPPVPLWVWLACALLVGAFVIFLTQLQPGREEIRRTPAQADPRAAQDKQQAPAPKAAEAVKPKYDFYTLLPGSEVTLPPGALPAPAEKPATVSPEEAARLDAARAEALLNGTPPPAPVVVAQNPAAPQLFLQAGSFRKREEADKLRARLSLLGQNVQIEAGKVREETWHRVLIGPFSNREQLAGAQKNLAASGFSNLLLLQR